MNTRGSLVRNTQWNIAGLVLPTIVAIFTIPSLINGLGAERFGILAIGWVVLAYFTLFDLGLGRATTKYVSEYMESKYEADETASLIWNSLLLHILVGVLGGVVLAICAPLLVDNAFSIPEHLRNESLYAFYALAASIPFIITASCLRGALEAVHRFDLVNYVKIPGSILNYIGPLLVLLATPNIAYIVSFILVIRIIVFLSYFALCLNIITGMKARIYIDTAIHKKLFRYGGWLTISGLISPIITFSDRFIIAAFFSLEAVTYYVTPYEVVTKLWIFSMGLLGVLFPVFSALSVGRMSEIRRIGRQAINYLIFVVAPIVIVILIYGREFLFLWVGIEFSENSTAVAKWLALGVFINVLAQVPYTIIQSIGRADIVSKVQVLELIIYIGIAWQLLNVFGTVGVAMAWVIRSSMDAIILTIIANKLLPEDKPFYLERGNLNKLVMITLFFMSSWLVDSSMMSFSLEKLLYFTMIISIFLLWEWMVLLSSNEKRQLTFWARKFIRGRA